MGLPSWLPAALHKTTQLPSLSKQARYTVRVFGSRRTAPSTLPHQACSGTLLIEVKRCAVALEQHGGTTSHSIPSSHFASPPGGVGAPTRDVSGAGTPACGSVQTVCVLGAKPEHSGPMQGKRLRGVSPPSATLRDAAAAYPTRQKVSRRTPSPPKHPISVAPKAREDLKWLRAQFKDDDMAYNCGPGVSIDAPRGASLREVLPGRVKR
ncbi:hypothetical protein VTO73DRAFT_7026 [Trametes versicolor]